MATRTLRHILGRRSWTEWIVFFVLLALSAVLGYALSSSTVWISARSGIYQALSTFGQTARTPQHTAIVLLDDTDFWTEDLKTPPLPHLAGRVPTNRAYLTAVIDKLSDANARVIVLDFDLRSPDPTGTSDDLSAYAAEDELLFASIRKSCEGGHKIVLASELVATNGAVNEARNIYDSANLSSSCIGKGYLELPRDIRRFPGTVATSSGKNADSLSLAAVKAMDEQAYDAAAGEEERDFSYSEFLPLTAFHAQAPGQTLFAGRDIVAATSSAPLQPLANRVVLVGADWHTLALGEGPFADRHPTPAHELPGVVLHANYIEGALGHGTSKPFPEALAIALECLLVLFLSVLGMLEVHWAWKWGAVLASSLGVVIFSYLALRTFGIVLDFFFPLIFVGVHSAYEHMSEWRHEAREE